MSMLDTVPLERIELAAAEVDFGRGVRRMVAALVYYPARLVGSVVAGLGWAVAAWKVGYADGRRRWTRPVGEPVSAVDRTVR